MLSISIISMLNIFICAPFVCNMFLCASCFVSLALFAVAVSSVFLIYYENNNVVFRQVFSGIIVCFIIGMMLHMMTEVT